MTDQTEPNREAAELAAIARLFAHPLRVRILELVREREASASQLAPMVGASPSAVAYHVRLLAAAGALELQRERRVRGATEQAWRTSVAASARLSAMRGWARQTVG